jgi:hypothetical protein
MRASPSHKVFSLMNRIKALIIRKDFLLYLVDLSFCFLPCDDTTFLPSRAAIEGHLRRREQLSSGKKSTNTLIIAFPTSRTVRK